MKGAAEARAQIVGREAELALLDEFLGSRDQALILEGGPGIGKTTLWEAGLELAAERGLRVLRARPSDAEAQLSFAALADLLDEVDTGALAGVPAPQRRALEVALFRAEPVGGAPDRHAIALGLLHALRAMAARDPVLVAVDDIQWLDIPSGESLAFAVRRLEGRAVRFLVAERSGSRSPLGPALASLDPKRHEVGSLSLGALRRFLFERLGLTLDRRTLRRVLEITAGNPLFGLELGRTLAERGPLALGEEIPVPDAVEELLGTRVAGLPAPHRRLLLALALSSEVRASQLLAIVASDVLDEAIASGLVVLDGERVRPFHPLLAAAAKGRSREAERQEIHLALAETAAEPELRARHLALGAEHPDAELAATLAAAASDASVRGARQKAAELAEHALRLTPDESVERSDRVLALGDYLAAAGERRQVTDLISSELDSLSPGKERRDAWLLLAQGFVRDNHEIRRYLDQALAESGSDPGLRADVLLELSRNEAIIGVERIPEAEAWTLEALPAARRTGPDVERHALQTLGWARALRGQPIDDVCERFRAASAAAYFVGSSPERVAGQRLVWRGEVKRARALLTRLLSAADERGEPYSYALARLHVCELELRIGEWAAASRLLDEWAESADRELVIWPMYERCRALTAAGQGLVGEAERWANEAIASAEETGVRWDLLEASRARGTAALLAHKPDRAAESLRPVWAHTEREGVDDPGAFPVAPDLVEALVEVGELEEASAVTDRLRELAEQQEHPWGLASAKRCAGQVQRFDENAATALEEAAAAYDGLGLRFDHARTLLVLGRTQRRHRKWAAARRSLERAASTFDGIGSTGWAEQARSELERIGARKPRASGELTPSEQRVAELAASGLSNKEIAQELVVTVYTVEAHLKHAYAKLGIRSRSQLAGRLPGPT